MNFWVNIATIATPVVLILVAVFFNYALEPLFLRRRILVIPEALAIDSLFYATNIGTRDVFLRRFGVVFFDGEEKIYLNNWNYSCLSSGKPIELKFSRNNGEHLDIALRKTLGQIHYVYVEDYGGQKYRAYPRGMVKSILRRCWYWTFKKKDTEPELLVRDALKINVTDVINEN